MRLFDHFGSVFIRILREKNVKTKREFQLNATSHFSKLSDLLSFEFVVCEKKNNNNNNNNNSSAE